MKWRRLWSLRRWSHVFQRIFGYLTSSRVSLGDKLLFLVPVVLYWVAGLYAFAPIDDIGVTIFADELVRIPRRAEISRCAR